MKLQITNSIYQTEVDDCETRFTGIKLYLNGSGYIQFNEIGKFKNKTIMLHRAVMNYDGKYQIDHLNNNKLDNRKINLSIITCSLNNIKRLLNSKVGRSGFKHIKLYKGRYTARLKINKKWVSGKVRETTSEAQQDLVELLKKRSAF